MDGSNSICTRLGTSEIKLYNDDVKRYIIFLGLRFKFIKKKFM